ncbi:AAA family ATPase [Pseudomonas sp. MH9.2]|uniref:ATP-dependent nuclease n=1 Tax=unclassified Pseudomonas TaxID=196821 RepID=UPI002AC98DF8|nr:MULTISPECIES: AAA family ATPase [unclassified Pseudomonas]MEB0028959.1 AAA family ATPase [Pseudomonas sp. MH9.2]MEB0120935.1 AAA family ATPase [Pseudomonas sp. CCI1.2]WPX67802.1 AAA family ATPase [Pseudomonas sp. MH9.2]
MHLSNLKLWNFRTFGSTGAFALDVPHLDLAFNSDLNVLIGENDSGKSAIIDAIRLVLKTHSYDWMRIDEDDFHFGQNRLRVELVLSGIKPEEGKNFTEFLSWRPVGDDVEPFLRLILDVKRTPSNGQVRPYEVRAGADTDGKHLSPEAREYLKVTYLKPLRDAEEELVARKNSRLSQILLGHEAFKNKGSNHVLMGLLSDFNGSIEGYFDGKDNVGGSIADQLGKDLKDKIDTYIGELYEQGKKTGLAVTERRQIKNLLEKLELSIQGETRPGLGTLNRLFMASELLHLNKVNWTGMRLGLIEELEAHLHPQAQMQAIETFQKQKDVQLILTTHSPNIGSKLELRNLIICGGGNAFPMSADHTELAPDDYVFLQRFLDVTKANLFFSKGVILVEGWSEELLMHELAMLVGYDLTARGVAVVNVNNLAFIRYANIFKRKVEPHFSKPVAIVTDVDIPLDEEDGPAPGDKVKLLKALADKAEKYDGQCVKSFIAPQWTLEYCLSKSSAFKDKFAEIAKAVHSKTDWTDFDATLANKLKCRSLAKTEISARLAQAIANGEIEKSKVTNDSHVGYLVKAIEYACGN